MALGDAGEYDFSYYDPYAQYAGLTWYQKAHTPWALSPDLWGPVADNGLHTAAQILAGVSDYFGRPDWDWTSAAQLAMPPGGWLLGANVYEVANRVLYAAVNQLGMMPAILRFVTDPATGAYKTASAQGVQRDAELSARVNQPDNSFAIAALVIGGIATAGILTAGGLATVAAADTVAYGGAFADIAAGGELSSAAVSAAAATIAAPIADPLIAFTQGTPIIDSGGLLSDATYAQTIAGQTVGTGAYDAVAAGGVIVDTGGAGIGSDATYVQATTGQFTEAAGAYTSGASTLETAFNAVKQAASAFNQIKSTAGAIAAAMSGGGAVAHSGGAAPVVARSGAVSPVVAPRTPAIFDNPFDPVATPDNSVYTRSNLLPILAFATVFAIVLKRRRA